MAFRKHRRAASRGLKVLVLASLIFAPSLMIQRGSSEAASTKPNDGLAKNQASLGPERKDGLEPYYLDRLTQWIESGATNASGEVSIEAVDISAKSPDTEVVTGEYAGEANTLQWKNDRTGWIEYEVDVPEDGLYEIEMRYHPLMDKSMKRNASVKLTVDGELPFRESGSVPLERHWKDKSPIKVDEEGDQIRPAPEEISGWTLKRLHDLEGAYSAPLRWYLPAGKHRLRLETIDSMVLDTIKLAPPTEFPSYANYESRQPDTQTASSEVQVIEAEQISSKTVSSIKMETSRDPLTTPKAEGGKILFNMIDGWSWWKGGQSATWDFEVPETGRYKIALRVSQQHYANKSTFRTIRIDGEVPFKELLEYRFPYAHGWYGMTLGGSGDEPFEFYLEKGKHSITMDVTHGPVKPVIMDLEVLIDQVRTMNDELMQITGSTVDLKSSVDTNRTWKIQELPGLQEKLTAASKLSDQIIKKTLEMNGERDDIVTGLQSAARTIRKYADRPTDLPNRLEELGKLLDKISGFHQVLVQQQLGLDRIYIAPVQAKLPRTEASFWESSGGAISDFFSSFQRKDDVSDLDENKLNVWVMRGRDHVNLLQELADELFTPETGIEVKVNLIPNDNLLVLANAANIQPDVALGLSQDRPFDYALRHAIVNLKEFPDFDEVAQQYAPGATLSYYFDGGYYALPETQSFNVMYYRKDILNSLGLKVPQTWDDLYEMLPTLQQNQKNFHIVRTEFLPFMYQHNVDFFKQDGSATALDEPQAFDAFKQWTDFYNVYGIKQEVPSFYQHFRRGTMPIGISDYNMFMQLTTSAPELYGRWAIAPIPGTRQPDGTIARWASGGQTAGVIYGKSDRKEEAWTFLKWWLSADVQERYGTDIEAYNGTEFRWNTANVEAFVRLPWTVDDLNVILEQWKWFKEMPNLPGSYLVTRELNNAWNRTVVDHMNFRTSLEKSIKEINREIIRKQQEFNFIDENGNQIKSLELPKITTPWKGVDEYARE